MSGASFFQILELKMQEDVCQRKMSEDQRILDTPILPWIGRWAQDVRSSFQECYVDEQVLMNTVN